MSGSDWAAIGQPVKTVADERDCGAIEVEREICRIDMVFSKSLEECVFLCV